MRIDLARRAATLALAGMLPLMTLAQAVGQTSTPSSAQTWPQRPIRMICPFPAGGGTDFIARLAAKHLSDRLGQQVYVENRGGANGAIGLQALMQSDPDGYTIGAISDGPIVANPALYEKLAYQPLRDFIPVAMMIRFPSMLIAHPAVGIRNVAELIALAKAKPGSLNYGMTGVGNSLHLTMEMFKRAAGIDIQAIPYRGDAPLNTALIANEVDVAIVPLVAILPHVQSGAIRALAVNSAQRSALLPDVPTLSEDAVPGFEVSGWQGWFVPAKTPPEVVGAIHRETAKIIADPAVAKRLLAMGNEPVGSTPEAFAAKFRDDVARFAKVIKDAGIPLQ